MNDALRETMSGGWIRSARVAKQNRLAPGDPEVMYGPWHAVLAQDTWQTWCGKQMKGAGLVQHRDDNPIGLSNKVCAECKRTWERGSPFPRANPAESLRFSSKAKTRNR